MEKKTKSTVVVKSILKKTSKPGTTADNVKTSKSVRFISSSEEELQKDDGKIKFTIPNSKKRILDNIGPQHLQNNFSQPLMHLQNILKTPDFETMSLAEFRVFLMKHCKKSGRKLICSYKNSKSKPDSIFDNHDRTIMDFHTRYRQNVQSNAEHFVTLANNEKAIVLDDFVESLTPYPDLKESNAILKSLNSKTTIGPIMESLTMALRNNIQRKFEHSSQTDKMSEAFDLNVIPLDLFLAKEKSRQDETNTERAEKSAEIIIESEKDKELNNSTSYEYIQQNSKKQLKPAQKNYIHTDLDYNMSRIAGSRGVFLFQQYLDELFAALMQHLKFMVDSIRKMRDSQYEIPYRKYLFSLFVQIIRVNHDDKRMFQKAIKTSSMQKHLRKLHVQLLAFRTTFDQIAALYSSIRETVRKEVYDDFVCPHEHLKTGLDRMLQILRCNIEHLKLEEQKRSCLNPKHVQEFKLKTTIVETTDPRDLRKLKLGTKPIDIEHEIRRSDLESEYADQLDFLEFSIFDRSCYLDELKMQIGEVNRELLILENFSSGLANTDSFSGEDNDRELSNLLSIGRICGTHCPLSMGSPHLN